MSADQQIPETLIPQCGQEGEIEDEERDVASRDNAEPLRDSVPVLDIVQSLMEGLFEVIHLHSPHEFVQTQIL